MAVDRNNLVFVDDEPSSSPESLRGLVTRNILSGAEKIAEIPFALVEAGKGLGQVIGIPAAHRNISRVLGKEVTPEESSKQFPDILSGVPTTEQFRRGTEKTLGLSEKYFEPKSLPEKIIQEGISNLAGTALTGGIGTAVKSIKPAFTASIAGNIAEEIGDFFGYGDTTKALLHTGGSILGGAYPVRGAVKKSMKSGYDLAEKNLPEKATVKAPNAQEITNKLLLKIEKSPIKEIDELRPLVTKFNNLILANEVNVKDAIEFKKALNADWFQYSKKQRQHIIKPLLDSIKDDIIIPYGKNNPEFLKPFLEAENSFAGLKNKALTFDKMTDTLKKMDVDLDFKKYGKYGDLALKGLGFVVLPGISYAVSKPLITTGAVAGGIAFDQLNKFAGLMKKSTKAQSLAKEFTKNLSLGHAQNASKILQSLNSELEQVDKKNYENLVFA